VLSVTQLGHGGWGGFVKKADEMVGHWQCRLWWPQHLSLAHPVASMALVGWVTFSKPCSVDLVIAATCPMPDSQSLQVGLSALGLELRVGEVLELGFCVLI